MAYILDGIIVVILIVMVALGHHRGFLRSVVQLVGLIAAFVVAFSLSAGLSAWIFDEHISEPLQETLVSALEEDVTSTAEEQVTLVVEALPDFLANVLNAEDMAEKAVEAMNKAVDDSATSLAETVVVNVLRPVTVALFRFVLFILLFIVLMVVVKLLTNLIKPLTNLPVIHQADGALGAAVGLVKGILFVLVAVTVMQLLASSGTWITTEQLNSSWIAGWVAEHNPVGAGLNLG